MAVEGVGSAAIVAGVGAQVRSGLALS